MPIWFPFLCKVLRCWWKCYWLLWGIGPGFQRIHRSCNFQIQLTRRTETFERCSWWGLCRQASACLCLVSFPPFSHCGFDEVSWSLVDIGAWTCVLFLTECTTREFHLPAQVRRSDPWTRVLRRIEYCLLCVHRQQMIRSTPIDKRRKLKIKFAQFFSFFSNAFTSLVLLNVAKTNSSWAVFHVNEFK